MANSLDALVPEHWSNEALVLLHENMVASSLVHRDFEDEVADFGDVVNTRRPVDFVSKRKGANDDVTLQDAQSTNVAVPLDQHLHVSFIIRDSEQSKAFQELTRIYLEPAIIAQARLLDRIVLGQYVHFLGNLGGNSGALTNSNVVNGILGTRQVMNENKSPLDPRYMVWNPESEAVALGSDTFHEADKVGDDGSALREASLGKKLGFWHFMDQNMSNTLDSLTDKNATGAINAGNLTKGSTALTVDGFSAAIENNSYVTVNGRPHRVVSTVGGATPTTINVTPGLTENISDNDVVVVFGQGAVNGAQAVKYDKYITFDTFTNPPQIGQAVSFGTDSTSAEYVVTDVTGLTMQLDRPLEVALADNAAINIGPSGPMNFAFNRNAIGLITRPLVPPRSGSGAISSVVNSMGMSMRATISYDGIKQGHIVTLDMLCGVKVLDTNMGAVLLG